MKTQKRLLALLLCVGMLFVLLASSAYIAHEADHHCAGEHCEICENIARMEALLQSFALMGVVLLFLFGRTSIDGTSSAVPSAQPTEDLILVQDLSPAAEEPGQTAPSSEAPEEMSPHGT